MTRAVHAGVIVGLTLFCLPLSLRGEGCRCLHLALFGAAEEMVPPLVSLLRTETDLPVTLAADPACESLSIHVGRGVVRLRLSGPEPQETTLQVDGLAAAHIPRAVALSAAGLVALYRRAPAPAAEERADARPGKAQRPEKPVRVSTAKRAPPVRRAAAEESSAERTPVVFRLGGVVGVKGVVRFPAWVAEAGGAFRLQWRRIEAELALLGLWTRKDADIGTIITAGVGGRLAVAWRRALGGPVQLSVGPSVALYGVWGIGAAASDGKGDARRFAPVLDVMLRVEVGIRVFESGAARIWVGGGYTPVYLVASADGEAITGLAGGVAALWGGVDFSL